MSLLKHRWEQWAVMHAMFTELLADSFRPETDKLSKSLGDAIELSGGQESLSELDDIR